MADGEDRAASMRGRRFTGADLTGARFRECNLSGARITPCFIVDVYVGGLIQNLVVNDVDVTSFVDAELCRRHPERLLVREMRTADEFRAAWSTIADLWTDAVARARRLPEAARHQQVEGEWSFVETLRHLVFATDTWLRPVLDAESPWHRLGLPHTSHPPDARVANGVDVDAHASFDEALAVRGERQATVRRILDGLSDDDLDRPGARTCGPGYSDDLPTFGTCLGVVMDEECEHLRYATRDLAVLEAT